MKFIAFAGSIRKESFNKKLINSLKELFPKEHAIEILNIENIPIYNQDLEPDNIPKVVQDFASKCVEAQGFFISTPEYNGGIPGALKNILDWLSRSALSSPLTNKPIGIMSASTGGFGGALAFNELKSLCQNLNMYPIIAPKLRVSLAQEKFDEEDSLKDDMLKNQIIEVIENTIQFAKKTVR